MTTPLPCSVNPPFTVKYVAFTPERSSAALKCSVTSEFCHVLGASDAVVTDPLVEDEVRRQRTEHRFAMRRVPAELAS